MSYELSFSQEFFMLPGENQGVEYPHGDEPYSVYGALKQMNDEQWAEMCEDVWPGCDPNYVTIKMIMDHIKQVNNCACLSVPVEVCIDEAGWHSVFVYEANGRPEQ